MVESFVRAEYERAGEALEDVDEEALVHRSILLGRRWPVRRKFERLISEGEFEWTWRDNGEDFSRAASAFVFAGLSIVGAVLLAQVVLRRVVDSYQGWSWVWPLFLVVALLQVGALLLLGLFVLLVNRYDQRHQELGPWAARLRDFHEAVRDYAMEPAVRELTMVHFCDPLEEIVEIDSGALTTTPTSDQIVRTETYREVSMQIARTDGATIGMRGSRGAGKTDLVRSFCEPQQSAIEDGETGTRVVGKFISAPTSLDEYAFLRRVALGICERTIALDGTGRVAKPNEGFGWSLPMIGAVVAAIGLVIVARPDAGVSLSDLGWVLVTVGGAVVLASAVRELESRRRVGSRGHRGGALRKSALVVEDNERKGEKARRVLTADAVSEARAFERRLRFSVSTTDKAEGGVNLHGLSSTVGRTVSSSSKDLTKEDIVDELGKLVGRLDAAGYRVVVGIDELDKLEVDEDTADLLNSMKSLFAIPSCSFIVTISSSAWSTFEQRGIRMRTVFDSSLDEVVEASPLSFLDARSLIRRRGAHVSDTQILFASASSGGIARDLLRNARRIALIGETSMSDLSTADAVSQFVEDEALSKIAAALLDLRGAPESAEVDRLAEDLDARRRALSDHGLRRGDEDDPLTSMSQFEELMDLLVRLAETRDRLLRAADPMAASDLPSQGGVDELHLVGVEFRLVSYLAFLRLLKTAFTITPIHALTTEDKVLYDDLSKATRDAFSALGRARVGLGSGCATAVNGLREARDAIEAPRSTEAGREGQALGHSSATDIPVK